MASSLAQQLAQGASLNAPILSETQRKKHASVSYLFASSKQGTDDLDALLALAQNALTQLQKLRPEFLEVEEPLFSQKARETDRTLLRKPEVEALDEAISKCLRMLGPNLLEDISGRLLEWLVKRFRINEFNVPQVLAVFLPYHESQHFAKMVTILHIDQQSPFAFLTAYKKAAKPLSRTSLASEMLKSPELTRSVISILPEAYIGIGIHRTLVCFNTSILLEYITKSTHDQLNAERIAMILPALLTPLGEPSKEVKGSIRKDCVLGSFVLLSALSQKCRFSPAALTLIVKSMIHGSRASSESGAGAAIDAHQILTALTSVLSPHDALAELPPEAVEDFLKFKNLREAVGDSFAWAGAHKVYIPMIPFVLSRLKSGTSTKKATSFLEHLLHSPKTPQVLLEALTKALILMKIETKDNETNVFTTYLSMIHQRHIKAFQNAMDELISKGAIQKSKAQAVALQIAAKSERSKSRSKNDTLDSVSSSDPLVRSGAIREILQALDEQDSEVDQAQLEKVMLSQLAVEVSSTVAEAMYESPGARKLLATQRAIISASSIAKTSSDPNRTLIQAHLKFFCNAAYEANPELGDKIILDLIIPFSYYTKKKWKTTQEVWELVKNSALWKSGHGLLSGLENLEVPVVEEADPDVTKDNTRSPHPEVDSMMKFNMDLVATIASNIKSSKNFKEHVVWLIAGVANPSSRKWPLCSLIVTKLIESLTGDAQWHLALDITEVLSKAKHLAVNISGEANLKDDIGTEVVRQVVQRPNVETTTWRLRLYVIMAIISIPLPCEDNFWIDTNDANTPAGRYYTLARKVYQLVNSSTIYQAVTTALNSRLFQKLGVNTLLFLMEVFVSRSTADNMKCIALKHASAFLRAQIKRGGSPCDFQTMTPSLLHVLQSRDQSVRSAAVDCLEALYDLSQTEKPSSIYGLDVVYGSATASLQYLEWADEKGYLAMLNDQCGSLRNDAEYLSVVHSEYFGTKTDSKKENKARSRVLCYLLSHVTCAPNYPVKNSILKTLLHVSDKVKIQMLLTAIGSTVEDGKDSSEKREFLRLALESFDRTSARELNTTEGQAWTVFTRCLKQFHGRSETTILWEKLASQVRSGLFQSLGLHRQVELCLLLLSLGNSQNDPAGAVRSLLAQLLNASPLILNVVKEVCKPVMISPDRLAKKAKLADAPPTTETTLPSLTVLMEVLSTRQLPGSYELVSALLEILGRVASLRDIAQSEISYLQQLIMAAVEASALQIKELPNVASNAIRVDVLVDVIRTSNPQTFNQALLLMATLARLSPDSVLHNVMPIFTFMGSNVFHRDDSYSFKVIQKTTESIVPVVVKSLKEKHTNNLALYLGARDFLRTFTDASTHIPRHRRTSFFTHLVGVLGADDFLAPICMLLADKNSNRIARQKLDEASSALSLALTVLQHFSVHEQVTSMTSIASEAKRLQALCLSGAAPEQTFLELTLNEDHGGTPASFRQRQCNTLLALIGHSARQLRAKQETDTKLLDVISTLLEMTSPGENTTESVDLLAAIRWALTEALLTISAVDFAKVVLTLLRSEDKKTLLAALHLLSDRLPLVTPSARATISQSMSEAIELMRGILSSPVEATLQSAALTAIKVIANSAQALEELALSATLPVVLDVLVSHPDSRDALDALPPIILKLGPRIIQSIRDTVTVCVIINQQGTVSSGVSAKSFEVLLCLIKTVPSFIGAQELKDICNLYIDAEKHKTPLDVVEQLGKQLTKKVPSKTFISAMCSIWPPLEGLNIPSSANRFNRFFELLTRSLHVAPRKDVMDNLRILFENFQKSIAVRTVVEGDTATSLEDSVIKSFIELVIKLNETSFRPLFRRIYDWAFNESSGINEKITFNKIYKSLLDVFKDLMTPYLTIVSIGLRDTLTAYSSGQLVDTELWKSCMETLTTSFIVDDNSYWRDDRLRQITEPIISQLPVCITLRVSSGKALFSPSLLALVDRIDEDALLRTVNREVLAHTRSEDARVRLCALTCASELWEQYARKLAGFANETATFIIECADDDNDDVVRECKRLKDAVERETGKIEGI